jgi:hypothetical protein
MQKRDIVLGIADRTLDCAFHHLVFDQMHDPPPSRASLIERSIARCGVAASR